MQDSWETIQAKSIAFSRKWRYAAVEKRHNRAFLSEFLSVFGVEDPDAVGVLGYDHSMFDGAKHRLDFFWPSHIAIKMESKGSDLGSSLVEARDCIQHLPDADSPELLLVCDFDNMKLRIASTGKEYSFRTKDLHKHTRHFAVIARIRTVREFVDESFANAKATEVFSVLCEALRVSGYAGHDLEVYLCRLLFCLFANDTGIFPKDALLKYVENSKADGSDLSERIARLFEVLSVPTEYRAKRDLLSSELMQFRFINGGLFGGGLPKSIFDAKMRETLIECMEYDWSKISPAFLGAMLQGVMDKSARREHGVHYTSEENILKQIGPLFLDELREEFERVKTYPRELSVFHEKIARLKFLDPACGCGNFLIIAYRELRLLELDILRIRFGSSKQRVLDISGLLLVSVDQYYGIEISDYPCQIARVGMWLMEHLLNTEACEECGGYSARLPFQKAATIVCGNALSMDWESVIPKTELSYIIGNPPFIGSKLMTADQRRELLEVISHTHSNVVPGAGTLDYVTAWYFKAADYMTSTSIRAAFVSTNSISQGEQVGVFWKILGRDVHINFAYRSFKWGKESKTHATVSCVIIGFSRVRLPFATLYDGNTKTFSRNINGYLVNGPNVYLDRRDQPLCSVPRISMGNKPIDDGNYLFTETQKHDYLAKEPAASKWFRPWMGAEEFINGRSRYCLWLGECTPAELRRLPETTKRVESVKAFRLASKSVPTRRLAETPCRFHIEIMPTSDYILIPGVSSERRSYVPIGFVSPLYIASNAVFIIPDATLYHFGVLTSAVHMAWMRSVCGRLGTGYRYSKDIVYNNFPWPDATEAEKAEVMRTANGVLDARSRYRDSILAELYDPVSMPLGLFEAHRDLDSVVLKLYGFNDPDTPESAIVADLFRRYQKLIVNENRWTRAKRT